jgi:ubiquinone/menaquinone biosynthesis C-methylase UbiE
LSKKLRLVTALNGGPGKLLDIGAGTGDFLVLSKKFQWDVQGVEPDVNAGSLSATKGVDLVRNIDELEGQLFDVVTLWHVLEHLPNLDNTLVKIEALIRPGGNLIIAAPNYNSFDAAYYKEYWAAYDTPRHLWHFSKESMSVLFSRGMTLFKVKPLIFDSFYVSLLSEKYKSGSKFSMKAIFIGLWSNISAWRTKEFSSLVYCFKKAV